MSGYQAYLSFANYMKTTLTDTGITVVTERVDGVIYPYLVIQDGPDDIVSRWISNRMVQGWLVVQKEDTRPLVDSMGRALQLVIEASRDIGQIPKYDFPNNPTDIKGQIFPKISQITNLMPGSDPNIWRRVLTWELSSNCG